MSDTPETDEAWKSVSRTPDGMYDSRVPISAFALAMSNHSKKMERQRDALANALDEIRALPTPQGCDPDLLTAVSIATSALKGATNESR